MQTNVNIGYLIGIKKSYVFISIYQLQILQRQSVG